MLFGELILNSLNDKNLFDDTVRKYYKHYTWVRNAKFNRRTRLTKKDVTLRLLAVKNEAERIMSETKKGNSKGYVFYNYKEYPKFLNETGLYEDHAVYGVFGMTFEELFKYKFKTSMPRINGKALATIIYDITWEGFTQKQQEKNSFRSDEDNDEYVVMPDGKNTYDMDNIEKLIQNAIEKW